MKRSKWMPVLMLAAALWGGKFAHADNGHGDHRHAPSEAKAPIGPHGGEVSRAGDYFCEVVFQPKIVRVYLFDDEGRPVPATAMRGTVTMKVTGNPREYRYELTPESAAGADEMGMRQYVLVILKSSPTPVPAGPERDEMFRGHFANMKRLSDQGKLLLAGPLDGQDGWRGLFVLDVAEIAEAEALVATDPVVAKGEMIPECHQFYGSAALRFVRETHPKLAKKSF